MIRKTRAQLVPSLSAPGLAGRQLASAEACAARGAFFEVAPNILFCLRSMSCAISQLRRMRLRVIVSGAKVIFATLVLFATSTGSVCAEDVPSSLLTQPSLTDTPDGPKEQLQSIGIMPDVWVTQFYQGQTEGDGSKTWRYGRKLDVFLKVDAEKLGLWRGFHINVQ
jgi:hypothetical protein